MYACVCVLLPMVFVSKWEVMKEKKNMLSHPNEDQPFENKSYVNGHSLIYSAHLYNTTTAGIH